MAPIPDIVFPLLRRDEALRLHPYQDALGFWTIGYGHLIDRRRGGSLPAWISPSFPITTGEAEELLRSDVMDCDVALRDRLPWWDSVDGLRRALLLSMAFQLGVGGLLGFPRMLAAAAIGRWAEAADEMRDSLWYGQTHGRAERLAQAMASGSPLPLKLEVTA